jgi:NAD(P)H-flavin reductase
VTDLLPDDLSDVELFACGPPAMLEAIRALRVPAQLALESGMACGFGACFGCVTPLTDGGYARVCVDGPVFAAADLAEVPAH